MDQEKTSTRIYEILPKQIIFKGIRGKSNGLICFGDKEEFLTTNANTIAWSALTGRPGGGGYCDFGLRGIKGTDFHRFQETIPGKKRITNYMRTPEIYSDGGKDFLIFFGNNSNLIGYSWLLSPESTGDTRGGTNILITKISPEAIETLKELATKKPTTIYDLLISTLYPTALVPLSRNEIIQAVNSKAPNMIRITRIKNPKKAKLYESNLKNTELLISNVQPKSTLKRRAPCQTVEIIER